jgi:hypothetical protein
MPSGRPVFLLAGLPVSVTRRQLRVLPAGWTTGWQYNRPAAQVASQHVGCADGKLAGSAPGKLASKHASRQS